MATHTSDDDKFQHGDFTLVSSDGVRFRVPSYHLFSASSFFLDAASMCDAADKKLELVDPDFETHDIVRAFLDLIVDFSIDTIAKDGRGDAYSPMYAGLCKFFDKFDCQMARRQLAMLFLYNAPTLIRPGLSDSQAFFVLGAICANIEMCYDAIRLDRPWPDFPGNSHLAPSDLKYIGVYIPSRYQQALATAWNTLGPDRPREIWAAAFKREIEAASDAGGDSHGAVANQQQAT
ncbi:uncharacterized protein LOC62_03G004120 [Vanrija pseudolonga]|uniref:BTB domain-containing protein n=1 Tax=Vanrija pseudolonga TaxID=143232 RepID=A0AAF1BLA5_9TREE|nr:hypothetical protein LOC62_03G004120 [Vanrija pseudolonga]